MQIFKGFEYNKNETNNSTNLKVNDFINKGNHSSSNVVELIPGPDNDNDNETKQSSIIKNFNNDDNNNNQNNFNNFIDNNNNDLNLNDKNI